MDEEQKGRIEARAEAVLAEVPDYVWDGRSLPVPVEAIVDSCFNLLICDKELAEMQQAPDCPPLEEDSTLSGLFLPKVNEIWVNAEEAREWPPRRRFTIGHELGHCVLHQDGQRTLFCRHGSIDVPDEGRTEPAFPARGASHGDDEVFAAMEREANHFAACLLMPGDLMRHHYKRTQGDFDVLCKIFGSSRAAMGRRLHQAI